MGFELSRRASLRTLAGIAATPLASCAHWIPIGELGDGVLRGRCLVEWVEPDYFIYRKTGDPLRFKPSFMAEIVPDDMYTDGGTIPRVLWGIPGLSPWALGPAYVIHDWIFEVHRCQGVGIWARHHSVPDEVKQITFTQSARILGEVAKVLIKRGLVKKTTLVENVVWAVQTRYARGLWDKPGDEISCKIPLPAKALDRLRAKGKVKTVVDFEIP